MLKLFFLTFLQILTPILTDQPSTAVSYYSRSITVDHTKVPANVSDFAVLVSGTYTYLKTTGNGGKVSNASGYDVVFYTSSDCTTGKLAWEVETWDATTGVVNYWVKNATLSSSTDTVFYMCYGDTSITTNQSNATGTWDSNYKGVWHLPNGSTLTANDSTSNAVNGTLTNTPTAVAGKVDGAASFASASTQYITASNTINPTAITVSAWVNGTSFPNGYNSVVTKISGADYVSVLVKSSGKLALYLKATGGVSYDGTGATTLSTGTWYYLTLVYSSGVGLIGYVNASSDATAGADGTLATSSQDLRFASDAANANREWNGAIDEVRISDTVRSADWITAEYNNQSSPSTFYTVGSEVSH